MLGRAALVFLLVGFALPGPARAEPTEAERMARWADLRHAIFGDRVVEDAGDLVAIDAPVRAEKSIISNPPGNRSMIATLVIGSRFKLRTCSRTWICSPTCVLVTASLFLPRISR